MLSFQALVNKVIKFRKPKGLSVDTVAEDVMFQLCLIAKGGSCVHEDGTDFVPPQYNFMSLNPLMIWNASKAVLDYYLSGQELCSIDEALDRVNICFRCPLQVPFYSCRCGELRKQVEKIIPAHRREIFNPQPGACASCGCSVLAKANLPKAKVLESNRNMKYWFPTYCWQNE